MTKYENLLREKNIWKLNKVSVYPLFISAEGVTTKNLQKYPQNTGLTKNECGKKQHYYTRVK